MIGDGGQAKVYLVQKISDEKYYAMKAIRKDKVIEANALESIGLERKILFESNHPFLVDMKYGF